MNAESCSDYLSFVPKLRCFLKKMSSFIFLLRFLKFQPKTLRCSLRKKGLHLFSCTDYLSFIPKLRCSLKKNVFIYLPAPI